MSQEIQATIVTDRAAFAELNPDWIDILETCFDGMRGPDLTNSATWAAALYKTHLATRPVSIVRFRSGDKTVALLPWYAEATPSFPFARRDIKLVTSAYSGRCAPLVRDSREDVLESVLRWLRERHRGWDTFVLDVVVGSRASAALAKVLRTSGMPARVIATGRSPYIEFGNSWEQYHASLPKKLRWTIRKGEKDLAALGELRYEEIKQPHQVDGFLEAILTIERQSWKHESGTSISTHGEQEAFYRALLPEAARAGHLSGHLLYVGGQPAAYILGLLREGEPFIDLKESFDARFASQSVAHVLKRFAFQRLIESGVRVYDFMGECEEYKLRWTDKIYRRMTIAIFNQTLRGRFFYWRSFKSPPALTALDEAPDVAEVKPNA